MRRLKSLVNLASDFFWPADSNQILQAKKIFRPFMKYQQSWLQHFYPQDKICRTISTWYYLQKYMMPLIKKNASSYHIQGIKALGLETEQKPDFQLFKNRFERLANGFKLQPVSNEISAKEYFSLIQQRRFPCIEKMRSHEEIFCASAPDFWHEAIGHIAPLCFPEVQEFYLKIANSLLEKSDEQFNQSMPVAWTLMEYGFLLEEDQFKMFGAALVGSHLANMRYLNQILNIEPAEKNKIINSNLYSPGSHLSRDNNGKLRFFYLDTLKFVQEFF
jgi:phenylalanine-4-hydroxylase